MNRKLGYGNMSMDRSRARVATKGEMKLTEEEYDCRAMGKFQYVTLFGIVVEPIYLAVTSYHVEPVP